MPIHHNPCFVIADGGHARFVKPTGASALHTVEAVDSATARKRSSDLGADRPGRTFASTTATRHAYTPRHDPHELERIAFARLVGEMLNDAGTAGGFDSLVLVAPADILKAIAAALDTKTEPKIVGTLEKDLVKVPDADLQPHLAHWLKAPHEA